METINYVFLGTTTFSYHMLEMLISIKCKPQAVFSLPKIFNISYSKHPVLNHTHANMEALCKAHHIPFYEASKKTETNLSSYYDELKSLKLDLILVLGWYYKVPRKIRDLAKMGAWGIHASLLPDYAGGAPLVWAMIEGQRETGVTLFRLDDGVDDGDIISQQSIEIKHSDTIKELYERATSVSKVILHDALMHLDTLRFTPQIKEKIKVYPQRSPKDGEIDLSQPANTLYNFIRAQSSPYPGAFIKTTDGKKLVIEKVRVEALE